MGAGHVAHAANLATKLGVSPMPPYVDDGTVSLDSLRNRHPSWRKVKDSVKEQGRQSVAI